MFLINNHFIFASDLCHAIIDWTDGPDDLTTALQMYIIENPEDIGDLMGAIQGVVFTGFIGELYKSFPFPEKPEDFKQNQKGHQTKKEVEDIIKKFAHINEITIKISKIDQTISIGGIIFNRLQFHEVIAYIWRGGMPQWKNDIRPDYVNDMMRATLRSKHWLFAPID